MTNVLFTIDLLLEIYTWIMFAAAVMSWLIGFNVTTSDKPALAMIRKVLDTLTEPVRRPMRRILPDLGGVDISPLILIVWIIAIRYGMVFFSVGRSTVAY